MHSPRLRQSHQGSASSSVFASGFWGSEQPLHPPPPPPATPFRSEDRPQTPPPSAPWAISVPAVVDPVTLGDAIAVAPDELTLRLMTAGDEKKMTAAETAALDELTIYHAPDLTADDDAPEDAATTHDDTCVMPAYADDDVSNGTEHAVSNGSRCYCRHCLLQSELTSMGSRRTAATSSGGAGDADGYGDGRQRGRTHEVAVAWHGEGTMERLVPFQPSEDGRAHAESGPRDADAELVTHVARSMVGPQAELAANESSPRAPKAGGEGMDEVEAGDEGGGGPETLDEGGQAPQSSLTLSALNLHRHLRGESGGGRSRGGAADRLQERLARWQGVQ